MGELCLHGHLTLPADLSDPDQPETKFANILPGAAARVIDVIEDVPKVLRYLDSIRIRSGARVDVWECGPLGRPVTATNARGRRAFSIEPARLITVEPEATAKLQTA